MAFVRSGAASKVNQGNPKRSNVPATDAGAADAGCPRLTPVGPDEPIGMVLARCYRLARERARTVRNEQHTPAIVDLGGVAVTTGSDDSTVKPDRREDDNA